MVTDKQVQLLRLKMKQEKTIEAAAAAAGMSARSAHNWKAGPLPSQTKKPRHWRTRVDQFAGVWEADVVPLLERDEAGVLEATTILALSKFAGGIGNLPPDTFLRALSGLAARHQTTVAYGYFS